MEIIDFHCHPFLTDEQNLCFYTHTTKVRSESISEDMESVNISRFCGSVISPKFTGFDTLHTCNMTALELRKKWGDKYIPGFHISPQFVEESIAEIELAHKNGVKFVGELVPYMHGGYSYYSDEFSLLINEASKYNMPINLHTMNLDEMRSTAKKHKDATFIFAHPGEKVQVLKHIEVMKECDNVYLDMSGTGILRWGMLTHVVNEVGADRILFGTDYPIGHPVLYVTALMNEPISDNDKELIFAGNTKRILGI